MVARCQNLTEKPRTLKTGSTIGTFTVVEADRIDDRQQKLRIESRIDKNFYVRKKVP